MSHVIYRPTQPEDLPQLLEIWKDAYQGDLSCANIYFDRYYRPGEGVVADCDGTLTSAIYLIDGYTLHIPGKPSRPCTYLYALGTPKQYRGRGYGGKTIWRSGVLGYDRGADFVCFLPASQSLYRWYEGCIGTRTVFYRREFTVTAPCDRGSIAPLSADAYGHLRQQLLQGYPHTQFPTRAIALQGEYCRLYGGDLIRIQLGDHWGIAAYDREGESLTLRELLFPGDPVSAAGVVLTATGATSATVRMPVFWGEGLGTVTEDNVLVPGGYTFPGTTVPPWWGFSMD